MKVINLSVLLILGFACSTLTPKVKNISLQEVENLKIGVADRSLIEKTLGKPQRIVNNFPPNEIWVQSSYVTLTFDAKGILIGAVWVPNGDEPLTTLAQILSHYKDCKFAVAREGWDKLGHHFSDDVHYFDYTKGIGFVVHSKDQTVSLVSFGQPDLTKQKLTQGIL